MAFGRQPCCLAASLYGNLDLSDFFEMAAPISPMKPLYKPEKDGVHFGTNCCLPGTATIRGKTCNACSLDWALGPSAQSYLIIWVFRPLGLVPGQFCPEGRD